MVFDFMLLVVFVGIRLGSMLLFLGTLSLVISIPRRSSGLGFHQKDRKLRRLINPRSFGGKIIVLWCSGMDECEITTWS